MTIYIGITAIFYIIVVFLATSIPVRQMLFGIGEPNARHIEDGYFQASSPIFSRKKWIAPFVLYQLLSSCLPVLILTKVFYNQGPIIADTIGLSAGFAGVLGNSSAPLFAWGFLWEPISLFGLCFSIWPLGSMIALAAFVTLFISRVPVRTIMLVTSAILSLSGFLELRLISASFLLLTCCIFIVIAYRLFPSLPPKLIHPEK